MKKLLILLITIIGIATSVSAQDYKFVTYPKGKLVTMKKYDSTAVANKYDTSLLVHKAGAETITGAKTFTATQNFKNILAGVTTPYQKPNLITFGTSVTQFYSYNLNVATSLNCNLINKGLSGSSLHDFVANGRCSEIGYYLPGDTTLKYILFEYSINDCQANYTAADFSTKMQALIDTCVAHGISLNKIVWTTPSYAYKKLTFLDTGLVKFADTIVNVARRKGVYSTDTYYYMRDNYGPALCISDSIHPNPSGILVLTRSVLNALPGSAEYSGTLSVRNSARIDGNLYLKDSIISPNGYIIFSNAASTGSFAIGGKPGTARLQYDAGSWTFGTPSDIPLMIGTYLDASIKLPYGNVTANNLVANSTVTTGGTQFGFQLANAGNIGSAAPAGVFGETGSPWFAKTDLVFKQNNSGDVTANAATEFMRGTNGGLTVGSTSLVNSALFSVGSTTRGILIPRMTTTQKNAISLPAEGLMVYDLTLHKLYVYDGSIWQAAW